MTRRPPSSTRTDTHLPYTTLFRSELVGATSWIAGMLGQNIWPDRYDPVADTLDEAKVAAAMAEMRAAYRRAAERLPPQGEFLRLAGAWTADAAAEVAA